MQIFTALFMMLAGGLFIFDNVAVILGGLLFCRATEASWPGIWYFIGLPILFLLGWGCAMVEKGMMTINYCGSRLYGKTPTENGYIATKWIVFLGFPVLPVTSYEVRGVVKSYPQSRYDMRPLDDFAWPQIIRTGSIGYGILLVIEVAIVIILNIVSCSLAG
jgi:hypothetical protein